MAGNEPTLWNVPAFSDGQEVNVDNITLTHKAVSTTAPGQTVLAGTASKVTNVYGLTMTAVNTVKVTFNSKVATTNTAIRSFNMIAGVPIVLPVGKNGDEHFATASAGALTASLSAAVETNISVKTKAE